VLGFDALRSLHRRMVMSVISGWLIFLVGSLRADPSATAGSAPTSDAPAPGERAIEGRLMAPCCWAQTLDVHESEIAVDLRHEIRARLIKGQSATVIEGDLIDRYGPRMVAAPPGDPLKKIAVVIALIAAISGLGIGLVLKRWVHRSTIPQPDPSRSGGRDEWDDRLDAELEGHD
jgi:cytochrome c-type biogenesis protein CcmH